MLLNFLSKKVQAEYVLHLILRKLSHSEVTTVIAEARLINPSSYNENAPSGDQT